MTDLVIESRAAKWIARTVRDRDVKGLVLVAATLAPCGDVTALYRCTTGDEAGTYMIFWFVDDPDAFDTIRNECGASDFETALPIYRKWVAESEAEEVQPDWEAQAAYDAVWSEPLEMNMEY